MNKWTEGIVVPHMCGVGLALLVTFLAVFEIARTGIITTTVQSNMRRAIGANLTENKVYAYDSLREGLSGAYTVDGSGSTHENVHTDAEQRIVKGLNLKAQNGAYVEMNGTQNEFALSELNVQISNPNPGSTGIYSATITGTLSIFMPLSLPPIQIPLSANGDFASKF